MESEPEDGPGERDDWIAPLRALPGPSPGVESAGLPSAEPPDSQVLARLAALGAAVDGLRAEVRAGFHVEDDPLAAVHAEAGDPRTYDAPDSRRVGVFI